MKKHNQTITGPKIKVLEKIKLKTPTEELSEQEVLLALELEKGGLIEAKKINKQETFILSESGQEIMICLS